MNLKDYRPMLFDPTAGTSGPFSEGTDGVGAADYSPDGGLVAFQSLHIDGLQIWLQRVDHGVPSGPLTRVSREGGIAPVWSPDGRSLFYIRWRMEEPQTAHLMSVQVERTPILATGTRTVVADWSGQGIDSVYRFDIRPKWRDRPHQVVAEAKAHTPAGLDADAGECHATCGEGAMSPFLTER